MLFLINKSIQSIDSLKHFYEAQKKYINQKSQKGMKENKMGYLADFYFNVLTHGTEEEKSHPTIVNLKEALDKHIDILEVTDRGVRYSITSDNPELFTNITGTDIHNETDCFRHYPYIFQTCLKPYVFK